MGNDKNRKEGYYWVSINDKWEPGFWNTKNWKVIYMDKPVIVDKVGSFIGAYGQSSHEELAVLPLWDAINCTNLEPDFVEALNQLIDTQRKPTKERF
jgi:hypothetical protein